MIIDSKHRLFMGLFNKYFPSNQKQRRDYEFYIGLCFEIQENIFKDHIFTEPTNFSLQPNKNFLPSELYENKTSQSFEKLVLNAMLISICIKKIFGFSGSLDELWKKEDEGLKGIIIRFATIMTKNPLFSKKYLLYDGYQPSDPMATGLLYIQNRFFDYADFLEEYFDENFEPSKDYGDDEADHSLEDHKARMIRLVYKYYAQPFCKYPKSDVFNNIDIDEFENIIYDFEKMINDVYKYLSDKLLTGQY